jgi:hypothetical protein
VGEKGDGWYCCVMFTLCDALSVCVLQDGCLGSDGVVVLVDQHTFINLQLSGRRGVLWSRCGDVRKKM